jgi:hypothetical protein
MHIISGLIPNLYMQGTHINQYRKCFKTEICYKVLPQTPEKAHMWDKSKEHRDDFERTNIRTIALRVKEEHVI